jgi:hypothetical protein
MIPIDMSMGAYLCKYFTQYTSTGYGTTTPTITLQSASSITHVTGVVTVDAPEPIVVLVQTYINTYYPMPDSYNGYVYPPP